MAENRRWRLANGRGIGPWGGNFTFERAFVRAGDQRHKGILLACYFGATTTSHTANLVSVRERDHGRIPEAAAGFSDRAYPTDSELCSS